MTYPLASGSVTLDSNGRGVLSLAPDRAHVRWNVKRLVTFINNGTADLLLFRNFESAGNLLDTTSRGDGDTSETDFEILPGERMIAVYMNGTAGSVATLVVSGTLGAGQ